MKDQQSFQQQDMMNQNGKAKRNRKHPYHNPEVLSVAKYNSSENAAIFLGGKYLVDSYDGGLWEYVPGGRRKVRQEMA